MIQRVENDAGGILELLLDVKSGHLVAGDDSGVIRIWQVQSERSERVRDIEPEFLRIDALAWSVDRSAFYSAGEGQIAGWTLDGSATGTWPSLDGDVLAIHPVDARRVLVASNAGVQLLDIERGQVLSTASAGDRNTGIAPYHDLYLVTACDQGGSCVRAYRLDGDALLPLDQPQIGIEVDHLSALAVRHDVLATADERLKLFDLRTGTRLMTVNPDGTKSRAADSLLVERFWTQCAGLGPQALICSSPLGPLFVFDVLSRKVERLDVFSKPATALTADGGVWAAASLDWSIYLGWETQVP
ncbi:MAG: hypothetical protein AAF654_03290 [Myxococcota bacterium]